MSPAQDRKYWQLWGIAARRLRAMGFSSTAASEERHKAHERALGHDDSHKLFGNRDCDRVFAEFQRMAQGVFGNQVDYARDAQIGEKRRLVAVLDELGAGMGGRAYWHAIAKDRFFGLTDPDTLTNDELRKLVYKMARAKRRKENPGTGKGRGMRPKSKAGARGFVLVESEVVETPF